MNKKDSIKTLVFSLITFVFGVFSTIYISYASYMTIESVFHSPLLILFPIAILIVIIIVIIGFGLILLLGVAPVVVGLISAILSIIALAGKETSINENTRVKLNKTARMFLIILFSIYLGIFVFYLLSSILK